MARRVFLHARDIELLELLAHRKVETLTVLHERLWPNATRKSAYERLRRLAAEGYLEHSRRSDLEQREAGRRAPAQHIYLLGPKAPVALRLRDRGAHALARRHVRAGLAGTHVEHQLATNRVGDWLGATLLPESEAGSSLDRRHRPDGAYAVAPDEAGRDLVLVEVDLGHYSRTRVLAKALALTEHPRARGLVFATPDRDRARLVARWIREAYGPALSERLEIFSFAELEAGARLAPELQPIEPSPTTSSSDWHRAVHGRPGVL